MELATEELRIRNCRWRLNTWYAFVSQSIPMSAQLAEAILNALDDAALDVLADRLTPRLQVRLARPHPTSGLTPSAPPPISG